jgi:hypothetical protein
MRAAIVMGLVMLVGCGRTELGDPGPPPHPGHQPPQCALGSTPIDLLAGALPQDATIENIFAADGLVYFNTTRGEAGSLQRVPGNGGTVEVVFDGPVGDFAVHQGMVAWEPEQKQALPTGTWTFTASSVTVRDTSGAQRDVTFSPVPSELATLAVNTGGDVFVRATWPRDSEGILEAGATSHVQLSLHPSIWGFWSDGQQLVWVRDDGDTRNTVVGMDADLGATPVDLAGVASGSLGAFAGFDSQSAVFLKAGPPNLDPDLETLPFTLVGVPRAGGDAREIFTSPGSYELVTVAVDDTRVYWVEQHDHKVGADLYRAERSGGAATHLTSVDSYVGTIALDACNVYLLAGRRILALAK